MVLWYDHHHPHSIARYIGRYVALYPAFHMHEWYVYLTITLVCNAVLPICLFPPYRARILQVPIMKYIKPIRASTK